MINEEIRKRIERLKNGEEDIERFLKYKESLSKASEMEIFLTIDSLGYMIWRTEHDLADGRIEYPEWDKNDKFVLQAEIELAVKETSRFDVPIVDITLPSEQYRKWYSWWKNYVENMPMDNWKKIEAIIKNKEDVSAYRPNGTWKE